MRLSRWTLPLLLAGGLGLFAGLCLELTRQARRQSEMEKQVLADHARAAAWRFATGYVAQVNLELGPAFGGLTTTPLPPDPLAQLSRSAREVFGCDDSAEQLRRTYFLRDLPVGTLRTFGGSADSLLRYYVDSLAGLVPGAGDGFLVKGFRRPGMSTRLLVTHPVVNREGVAVALLGFETCRAPLDSLFGAVFAHTDLLPPFLTGAAAPAEMLSIVVTRPGTGDTIFSTSPHYSTHTVRQASIGIRGLDYEVALNPERSGSLLQGIPPSRVPQTAVLLLLTGGVLSVTSGLLVRERRLIRSRTDFLASVSHELRTPLSQILLFAETLRQGKARTAQERELAAEVIDQEARRLLHLVQNVLYLAQSNRGQGTLVTSDQLLAPLIRDVVAGFAPLAIDREVAFRIQVEETTCARINPAAAKQILINLLDNAVKFGPANQQITVRTSGGSESVDLIVEDQGPGVAARHRERIWYPFYRAEPNTNDAPGSGIGLAIVADLATRQGGRVRYEPADPGGARFIVTLRAAAGREVVQ